LAPHSDKDCAPLIIENHTFACGNGATKLTLKINVNFVADAGVFRQIVGKRSLAAAPVSRPLSHFACFFDAQK
jgi:hypothetical protein